MARRARKPAFAITVALVAFLVMIPNAAHAALSDDNTAYGTYAPLGRLTTGTQNAAFGTGALSQDTTGANNTGVGYGAGATITTGTANTAIGTAALYNAGPTSSFNTVMGLHAARYIDGDRNTLIGADVAGSAVSISDTTALGWAAFVGGGGATAIGSNARAMNAGSIALGNNTTTTASAQVMVGARDVEITDATRGIILRSPNGARHRITVGNDGTLSTASVP